MKGQPHIIEALALHLNGEYIHFREANPSVWILLAMIIRLAMRMGYHLAPQAMSGVSVFQVGRPHARGQSY